MEQIELSVIIPAYRAASTIARAVESVLNQTRPAGEVLVIDDGSPDDPAPALAPFGDRVRLIRKPNGGAASARNLGIEQSRGRFLAFLDADDEWEPHKLERQLALFERHPEFGLVASRFYRERPGRPRFLSPYEAALVFDEIRNRRPWLGRLAARLLRQPPGRPRAHRVLQAQHAYDRPIHPGDDGLFDVATLVWTSTVVVRRESLGDHRFEPGLEPAEDRDLWVRLLASFPAFLSSEPLATAHEIPGSLSRSNINRDYGNMLRVVRRYRDRLSPRDFWAWETEIFWLWAAAHLHNGEPRAARLPAWNRLRRQPLSPVAWWVLGKSLVSRPRRQPPAQAPLNPNPARAASL